MAYSASIATCITVSGDKMFQCEIWHTICSFTPAIYLRVASTFIWKPRLKYPFPLMNILSDLQVRWRYSMTVCVLSRHVGSGRQCSEAYMYLRSLISHIHLYLICWTATTQLSNKVCRGWSCISPSRWVQDHSVFISFYICVMKFEVQYMFLSM